MAHKFNPKEFWKLDNPERRQAMPPGDTLVKLGLRENDVFVDVGCGTGYFTIPAIDIVGIGGKVYGLDTSQEMLDKLKHGLGDNLPSALTLIMTEEYDFHLQAHCASFAFMCNVLHEVDDPGRFVDAVGDILVPGGRFALIDWVKKRSEHGPPEGHRLEQTFVEQLLAEHGFNVIETESFGEEFYAIISTVRH
jgi:ubiquinone/menaquinone biosynthesis C-methylase UbiE